MHSLHACGYSLELNILLYKESKNGDIKSNDAFNISPVILSIPAALLFFSENITFRYSISINSKSRSLSRFGLFKELSSKLVSDSDSQNKDLK